MKAASHVVFAVLLSISMLGQSLFAAARGGDQSGPGLVRKCCRAEVAAAAHRCEAMSCCRKTAEVPAPASLPAPVTHDQALLASHAVLDYAPLAARPPTGGVAAAAPRVSPVPLRERYCVFLI